MHKLVKSYKFIFACFLFLLVFSFLTIQLNGWDNFLFRPASKYSDLLVTFWPNIHYIKHSLSHYHQLPLWRTLIFSGSPFDGDPQSGLWYLPNLLFLLIDVTQGLNILFLLHVFAGGLGVFWLSKEFGISNFGSSIAAVSYTFSPKIFAHLGFGHVGLVYASAYIPWILWASGRAIKGNLRYLAVFAFLLGLQIIANPQLSFYTAIFSWIYGVLFYSVHFSQKFTIKEFLNKNTKFLSGLVLAFGISAVQLIPMIRFALISGRKAMGVADAAISSLPPRYLAGLLIADHTGYMEFILYVGISVLLLAFPSLIKKEGRFWWMIFILALIFALGINLPLFQVIYRFVPIIGWLRSPARILFVGFVLICILAGIGFDLLVNELDAKWRKRINLTYVAMGIFGLLFSVGAWIILEELPLNLIQFGSFTTICSILILLNNRQIFDQKLLFYILFTLVLADLWIMDATLIEARSPDKLLADNGIAVFLRQQKKQGLFRTYSPSYSLPRQIGALFNLETADGVDPLYMMDYDDYMQIASGVERSHYEVTIPAMEGDLPEVVNKSAIPNLALLARLNVKYLVSEYPIEIPGITYINKFNTTYLYKLNDTLERAYFASQVIPVLSFDEAVRVIQNQSNLRIATADIKSQLNLKDTFSNDVDWLYYSPNKLEIKTYLHTPGFLVLSLPYHTDWVVEVDKKPTKIYRTNTVSSGLILEAGEHYIKFEYRPLYTYVGLILSTITSGLLLFIVLKKQRYI